MKVDPRTGNGNDFFLFSVNGTGLWSKRYDGVSGTWANAKRIDAADGSTPAWSDFDFDANGNAVCVYLLNVGGTYQTWANTYTASSDSWSGNTRRLDTAAVAWGGNNREIMPRVLKQFRWKGSNMSTRQERGCILKTVTQRSAQLMKKYRRILALSLCFCAVISATWAQSDRATALYQAIVNGDESQVEKLITKEPALLEAKYAGVSPLHVVTEKGHLKMAKFMLRKGAKINEKDYGGQTPIHYAAKYGQTEVAELLIKYGADINAFDSKNRTPLKVAMEEGQKEMEKLLRKHKAREDTGDF